MFIEICGFAFVPFCPCSNRRGFVFFLLIPKTSFFLYKDINPFLNIIFMSYAFFTVCCLLLWFVCVSHWSLHIFKWIYKFFFYDSPFGFTLRKTFIPMSEKLPYFLLLVVSLSFFFYISFFLSLRIRFTIGCNAIFSESWSIFIY